MKRALLCLALALVSLTPAVGGASMLLGESELVMGNQSQATAINIPSAGQLTLTLTDVGFTSVFSALNFAVSTSSADLVPPKDPGTMILDISGPTTLYTHVFAKAQGGFDLGMYNLTANFTPSSAPVPLPGTGPLLGAMLGLAWLGGRVRDRSRRAAT